MSFDHKKIETKWQQYWDKHQTFKTNGYDFSKPKYYALDMFPYPSGSGLHAGHPEGYTATDVICRMKRMQGFNVLHPMGFDAFGLPAEQYAIKTGNNPATFTEKNIETFKNKDNLVITDLAEQLQDCGIQALTIHGRTRSQMYTGEADWTLIGKVKKNPRIHIPIIGNGDVTSVREAGEKFDRYGVDAVMIGRATFGCPWIFRQGEGELTLDEKIDVLEEMLRINVERIDEYRGIIHTRRHLAASPIFKGIPDFRQTRISMLRATKMEELMTILENCRERLRGI